MKECLLALSLLLVVGTAAADVAPRHRHHPTTASAVDSSAALEAYSDTTSVSNSAGATSTGVSQDLFDDDDFDDNPFHFMRQMVGMGVGGIIIACLCILFLILVGLAPFAALVAIIYFSIRRHNDRVKLTEKAMEMGQSVPEGVAAPRAPLNDALGRKGVKNASVGIGLAMMFVFFHSKSLVGVGLFVLCYGLGQIYMARESRKRNDRERDKENNDLRPEF